MITEFKKYNLIKESPDKIELVQKNGNIKYIKFDRKDARPFFVIVNDDHTEVDNIFIGKKRDWHSDMNEYIEEKSYAGRLWTKAKILSFWVYPNEILFVSIIKAIEKRLDIKIFNNGWKIQVIKNDDKIKKRDPNDDDEFNNGDFYMGTRYTFNKKNEIIIPVEEYIGSEDQSEEDYNIHLKKWQDKEKEKKSGEQKVIGFGSDKTAIDRPHNIKYRQTIYQENAKYLRTKRINIQDIIIIDEIVTKWWNNPKDDDEKYAKAWLGDQKKEGNKLTYSVDTRGENIPDSMKKLNKKLNKIEFKCYLNDGTIYIQPFTIEEIIKLSASKYNIF